jgi:hypothetical protein
LDGQQEAETMTTNVNVDPVRAHAIVQAWERLGTEPGTPRVAFAGHDMLDGAAFCLLKAEFLAAQCGVVPFVPLPGGGQGVLTVGGALSQPDSKWPQPELRHLYMLNHKAAATTHASIRAARPGTPILQVPLNAETPLDAQAALAPQLTQLGVLPAAWVVVAAVGILATIAGSYYAVRTEEKRIETDANLAATQAKTAGLTGLAQQQLATQGKIDPKLIAAIKETGSATSWGVWPWVALGTGGVVIGATGAALLMRKSRR